MKISLIALALVAQAVFADPDPSDPRREVMTIVYPTTRQRGDALAFSELSFLKIYYWGVDGSSAVKLISPPLPKYFTTSPCAYGDYHASVIDNQNRESTLVGQKPYFVNKIGRPGC